MDMTDNTERMLYDFFAEARQQQIDDNGFTERVMQRLEAEVSPSISIQRRSTTSAACSPARLSRLWTWLCIAAGVVLFFTFHGWEAICVGLEVFVQTAPAEYNLMAIILSFLVLVTVGISEFMHHERISIL